MSAAAPEEEIEETGDDALDPILRELAGSDLPQVAPGEVLGERYRIDRLIGSGGMGVVYAARDCVLDRVVAIKVVRGEAPRFEREARTLSGLRHPNLAQVFDFGVDGAHRYLVMELLEGETLQERLRREGALPFETALLLASPIGHALTFIHQRGVVHRDVKPANVFLAQTPLGVVPKLIDFGIARREIEVGHVTQASDAIGTVAYMAPEQLRDSRSAGPAADQYAFATMIYQLVCGQLPYRAESSHAMISAKASEEPADLRSLRPQVPSTFALAIHRGLARTPEARFETVDALLLALRAQKRRPWWALAAVAVLIAASGIAWVAWPHSAVHVATAATVSSVAMPPPPSPVASAPAPEEPRAPSVPESPSPRRAPRRVTRPTAPAAAPIVQLPPEVGPNDAPILAPP